MEDLLNSIGDLGDLGDLGDFAGEDFDTLLEDSSFLSDSSSQDSQAEFDGLMDLTDFEELDSSSDMAGLMDMESDQWAFHEETENLSKQQAVKEKEDQKTTEIDSMLDQFDQTGNLTFSEEERQKEKEEQQRKSSQKIENNELDLDSSIDQPNDELRIDVPELDEKEQRKAFKGKKKATKGEDGKAGFWQKLFGNVPDENAEKEAQKEAERLAAKEAKKAAKKTKEEIAQEKQEKKKEKEEAAAIKKASQAEKKAQKEEQKKLKKEEKAAARAEEEAQEPPTRINRVGAGIIFVTFAMIGIVIVAGNNSYAYSQCIAKAAAFFSQKEYTNAYNQIYGVKVKKSDEELKDQVMTVMFIEKQLNSFDNYFAMEKYPEALDSLLKGLDKYDKYLEQARSLGIESDVNYVKNKILSELKSVFNISEKGAYKLLSASNSKEYTNEVIKAVNSR